MDDLRVLNVGGRAVPVRGDDIDTDRIFPARFMKEITFRGGREYPFYDARFNADGSHKAHPFNEARFQGAAVLVANANFGCGSSREHAPQALARWGIRAIVAESYGEIFAGNCAMLGIAAVTADRAAIAQLQDQVEREPQSTMNLDIEALIVRFQGISIPVSMPPCGREALISGTWDFTRLMRAHAVQVDGTAKRLAREYR
jgi:3-isopropylmalate/(R)-2-methylmalate dehydratase small subunit